MRIAAYLSHPETVRAASETGLDLAAYRVEIIELLLEHGADASARDSSGQPILFVYFAKIIESGSEDNCRSVRSPCPDLRVVELLLEHGAEVEVTSEGYTEQVMGYALWAGAGAEIIALLLEHGADATLKGDEGDTFLHTAALFSAEPQVFHLLLDNGADVAARGVFGRTALHLALRVGELDPQAIRALLDSGADVAARDEDGGTPLHEAVTHSGPGGRQAAVGEGSGCVRPG